VLAVTVLVLIGGTFLIHRSGKRLKRSLVANENTPDVPNDQGMIDYTFMPGEVITANSRLQLPSLGQFLFDVKAQQLLSGDNVIKLTDKECKVLELLHKHFGELIPRETLLQEIWINEGVITGRSLDMFVSKLRKKISSDPALKITNVHGKGYRLE
jgi:DNA-binding response OmpR family regulator